MQGDFIALPDDPAAAWPKLRAYLLSSLPARAAEGGCAPSGAPPALLDTRLVRSELLRLRAPAQTPRRPTASAPRERQGT